MSVAGWVEGRRVCICAGPGGVGKTTTSAAIALGMAARGLRVAVVTIDPAQRLADSLGLEELGNEPHRVDPERLAGHGIEMRGELWAMMLDPKRTFDELVERLAPDRRARDDVFANRIYQQLSTAIAGSQEFTAIAKLYELDREGGYDLIVLDTPPSRHALDFVEAPDRLTQFLEGRALKLLLRPTGLAARIAARGTGVAFGALRRLTGVEVLEDLSAFFRSFGTMLDGFRERAAQVERLLRDPGTTFLVVTSPERAPLEEALFLHARLAEGGLPFGGVVVNRMHRDELRSVDPQAAAAELEPALGRALAGRVSENLRDYHRLAERDAASVARLRTALGAPPLAGVPLLDDDVHDVDGLVAVHGHLF